MRLEFKGGFYVARNVIANAQRCANLYPEKNPEDAEAPITLYLTPGLKLIASPPVVAPFRALYQATNAQLYGVVGQGIYAISSTWQYTLLGSLGVVRPTPVSMFDNGITLFVVDGSPFGYTIDLATNAFAQINDPNFFGADRGDVLDGFALFNRPSTRQFYTTLDFSSTFDPLYVAAKSGYPDALATLIVMHREIWLLGSQDTTEVWSNVGNANFPFAIIPGVFIEHGCAAKYSIAKHDLMIFWLSVDKDGQATVFMGQNYAAKRISTPAIANAFSQYARIDDAIGMTYKQQDHVFYVLTFPTADKTWVYDLTEGLWHERSFTDANGVEHRIRANCMAFAYGLNLAGDFQNGNLYSLDLNTYVDNVNTLAPSPIVRRRGFLHIVNEGKRVTYDRFAADMACGEGISPGETQTTSPWSAGFSSGFGSQQTFEPEQIYLRWSDDRGHSWGNAVGQLIGATGAYLTQPQWRQLGMARDRVFELFWSTPVPTALQGAWVDLTPAQT